MRLLLTLLGICLLFDTKCLQNRQKKNFVERIDDIDGLKKILRTKNNVLILYARSLTSQGVSNVLRLLNDVSEPLFGKSTLLYVDCSSEEGKKTCKKMKVSLFSEEKPYVLGHYSNGKFNKEYDRSLTEQSLLRFLTDPTAELPWEEETDSLDVFHVPNAKAWRKLLKKEKLPILAMFYAPWCGYCKRLKPFYSSAASALKSEAILAALDVTRPELYELQQVYNITGFPTILYFVNGEMKFAYGGEHTKEGIIKWIKNPTAAPINAGTVEEITWSDEKTEIVHLTDDTFDKFVAEHDSVLVMFYAPWCGHCKAMKPAYAEAAKILKDEKVKGILAALDATKEKTIATKFDIKGFPVLKYFKKGQFAWDYNERTKEKLVEFMKDPQEPPPPPPPDKPWNEEEGTFILHLEGDSFRNELRKRKHAMVMFYAPWCGHCKLAKPEFILAAENFKSNPKVVFAAVDCTNEMNQIVCKGQEIKGFPTIRYFNYFKHTEDYLGGRSASDFIGYVDAQIGPPAGDEIPPIQQPEEEQFEPTDEDDTSDPESWGFVKLLTPENYLNVMEKFDRTLVMFFSPTCRYCEEIKPEFKAAAFRIKGRTDVTLAAMDCVQYLEKCGDFRVAGYPSLFLFEKAKYIDIHHGKPTRENFVRTILSHLEKAADAQPPSTTPPAKSEL